ncbi:MAG: sulfite exporter TauE/SafE family protein [Pirellulales bacterium]
MIWIALLLFGVAIGVASGLLGIGGGILLIPGLMILFGYSQAEAQGTSLAVMIPPIGIFAAMVYYQHGFVRLPVVGLIAAGFLIGAYVGARLVPHISPSYLRLAFGILLLYLGFTFVFNPGGSRSGVALPAGLAAAFSAFVAKVWRRRLNNQVTLPPPGGDHDYHI